MKFLDPRIAGDLYNSSHFCSSVRSFVRLSFVIKLVNTSPSKRIKLIFSGNVPSDL